MVSLACIGGGIAIMIQLLLSSVPFAVGLAAYLVVGVGGVVGVRFGLRGLRRRLFRKVVEDLALLPSAVGGATSAMLPALRDRDVVER